MRRDGGRRVASGGGEEAEWRGEGARGRRSSLVVPSVPEQVVKATPRVLLTALLGCTATPSVPLGRGVGKVKGDGGGVEERGGERERRG